MKELKRKEQESRELFERVQQQNLKRLVPVVETDKLKKQKKDIAQLIEQNINIQYEKTIAQRNKDWEEQEKAFKKNMLYFTNPSQLEQLKQQA